MRVVFVASDFSGLGKGTFSAALGRVLKSSGIDARVMKCDLYFNYDAGTISPGEHGEVYVLADGTETDQDLGIYERFLGIECNHRDYLTSGQVFHQIYLNERAGRYLGQTVSVEHVINEIKRKILEFAGQCEVGIIELGATIGDIKGTYFLEACRQLKTDLNVDESLFVLLSHFPYLENVQELKTMGCQRSVNDLRAKGIKPDLIVARTASHRDIPDYQLGKIQLFCEVPKEAVFCLPDLPDEYELPRYIRDQQLHRYVAQRLRVGLLEDTLDEWYRVFEPSKDISVALVGKYPHTDAYVSIKHQLRKLGVPKVVYMSEPVNLQDFDAVIIPGGWGSRGVEQLVSAAGTCREEQIPCLGICLGLQVMVIEYARNVLGLRDANSAEFNPNASHLVVILQEEQDGLDRLGGTSRLGNWTTRLVENSKIAQIYGSTEIVQRHRHRYEITSAVDFGSFRVVGQDMRTNLIEVMEAIDHPFYIGVQYHPEFSPEVNPLFRELVRAASIRRNVRQQRRRPGTARVLSEMADTYIENIDLDRAKELRMLGSLAAHEMEQFGISDEQRSLIEQFFQVLDARASVMDKIESEISACDAEMRRISLDPNHLEGKPLSDKDSLRLEELAKQIQDKMRRMRDLRDFYQVQLTQIDEALGRLKYPVQI